MNGKERKAQRHKVFPSSSLFWLEMFGWMYYIILTKNDICFWCHAYSIQSYQNSLNYFFTLSIHLLAWHQPKIDWTLGFTEKSNTQVEHLNSGTNLFLGRGETVDTCPAFYFLGKDFKNFRLKNVFLFIGQKSKLKKKKKKKIIWMARK